MKRPLFLLPALLGLVGYIANATPTPVKVQLSPIEIQAQVTSGLGATPGNYSGIKTGLKVDYNDPLDLTKPFTPDGYPYGAYCVDPDQLWENEVNYAKEIRLSDAAGIESDSKLGRFAPGLRASFQTNSLTAQQRYQHATYLTTFIDGASQAQQAAIWAAIWTFTDLSNDPVDMTVISDLTTVVGGSDTTTRAYWLARARDNTFTAINNWSQYALFSSYSINSPAVYHQEFVGQVPEPGAYFLMGTAFLGVFLVVRRNRKMARQVQL